MPKEELEAESPGSLDSQNSTALYSLHPKLPTTYNEAALSHLQRRQQVIICNNLFIPCPSNSECSTYDTDDNQSTDDLDDTDGSPAKVKADSSCLQIESPTAGTGMDMPTPQDVWSTRNKAKQVPDPARKMPLQQQSSSQGTGHYKTISSSLQDHQVLLPRPPGLLTGPSVHKLLSNIASKAFQDHCISIQHRSRPVFLFFIISRPSGLKKTMKELAIAFQDLPFAVWMLTLREDQSLGTGNEDSRGPTPCLRTIEDTSNKWSTQKSEKFLQTF